LNSTDVSYHMLVLTASSHRVLVMRNIVLLTFLFAQPLPSKATILEFFPYLVGGQSP